MSRRKVLCLWASLLASIGALAVISWLDAVGVRLVDRRVLYRGSLPTGSEDAEPTGSISPREPEGRPEPQPEHRRFYRVVVADGGRLEVNGTTILLRGISAPERQRRCTLPSGESWPCGVRAAAALSSLIRSRAVECDVVAAGGQEVMGTCRVGNTDLSSWMLRQGWAEASKGAGEPYAGALGAAKIEKLGLWSDGPSVH